MKRILGNKPWQAAALLTALSLAGLGGWYGVASAQVSYSSLTLQGTPVQSVNLYGTEYVDVESLRSIARVVQEGPYLRIEGYGHSIVMPIDEDAYRATTSYNTVQLDTVREQGRTATYVDGSVHVPLEVVARTFGATYRSGTFTLPDLQLTNVSSSVGAQADRLVLDLTQDTDVFTELRGNDVHVVMRGAGGEQRRYTTSGQFISNARVIADGEDLRLRFSLPKDSGYRMYKVIRPGSVRVVVDAGPSIERTTPALLDRISRPLIVIEPVLSGGNSPDFSLGVANSTAKLLQQAGWEVEVTRKNATDASLDQKVELARRSDVYLMLDVGRLPVEGVVDPGVKVYQQLSENSSEYVANIRAGENPAYAGNAVGGLGGTRTLSAALLNELKAEGVTAEQRSISKVLTLGEAPQAGVLIQLGSLDSADDVAAMGDQAFRQNIAVSVARSVASYLSTKVDNAAALPGDEAAAAEGAEEGGAQE
ncbi:N-acetylmuramoyl-L-alanine amidase [Deinococcus radiophilus]|uniref:N-acetylmuramoyl-L-alanine amidase n=1 Tax=Deinococcus radiophilus TaxID=32062 RepID=UPI001E3E1900|nr:N-acetylmuramoyl-L-alanine amidase [Deinococcus radiophilus]UFA50833.1 N-acetylmuramoyl-L-alanine amidase [Deinococcus radiophilus]